jgi:hypothetical protein
MILPFEKFVKLAAVPILGREAPAGNTAAASLFWASMALAQKPCLEVASGAFAQATGTAV